MAGTVFEEISRSPAGDGSSNFGAPPPFFMNSLAPEESLHSNTFLDAGMFPSALNDPPFFFVPLFSFNSYLMRFLLPDPRPLFPGLLLPFPLSRCSFQ